MNDDSHEHDAPADEHFSTAVAGLPESVGTEVLDLGDGETVDLRIAPVTKTIGDATVRMLAYNGSIPGPTLRVREGSQLVVEVTNEADLPATVHWHGLRLENRYDGTHETQAPIPVGGSFTYTIEFPDPGVYWYHPHIREDYGQEMGLYGNILVVPDDPDYWPPTHREVLLTLDDVLIEDGKIAKFSREETTHAAMGRFGNVMLIGGETDPSLSAERGEVVRFYLTNTANTRVFNVAVPGARIKLVGGDSGRHEHEVFVESVILAPSERVVVDVLFEQPGQLALEHRTPERTYSLAKIDVSDETAKPDLASEFDTLRRNPEWVGERERLARYFDAPPDKTLALIAEMDMGAPDGPVVYACPMHPEVVGEEAGRCPKCGMKLLATSASSYVCPMHPDVVSDTADHCPKCGMKLLPAALVAPASEHGHGHGTGMGMGMGTGITLTGMVMGRKPSAAPSTPSMVRGTGTRKASTVMRNTTRLAASSGKTTWSTSTESRHRRTCIGASSIERPAPSITRSTGVSTSAIKSSCDWSTRWTQTTRCITRSTSMAPAGSSFSRETARQRTIWSGKTLCSCEPARPSTSFST